jgi:hypothetical protein
MVAVVYNPDLEQYDVVVYNLELEDSTPLPIARMPLRQSAYNLQARYMPCKGHDGIMISFIVRDLENDYEHSEL